MYRLRDQAQSEQRKTQLADILVKLMDDNANVNAERNGTTPFKLALQQNLECKILELLIQHGGDVNVTLDELGTTPMMTILDDDYYNYHDYYKENIINLVQLMLQKGAKINQTADFGGTAFNLAVMRKDTEIVKLLLEHGADPVQWFKQPRRMELNSIDELVLKESLLLEQRRQEQAETTPEIVELIYTYASQKDTEIRDNKALYVMPETLINSMSRFS